jgi:hypothetical protein
MEQSYDQLIKKWSPVLNESSAGEITDSNRRSVTAVLLENQQKAMQEQRQAETGFITEAAPATNTGSVGTWDPVLISLVRRAMPNLMAYDVCGVQPMTGPTGLIFAMKAKYGTDTSPTNTADNEAMGRDEVNTFFSAEDATGSSVQTADPSGLQGLTDASGTDNSIGDDRVGPTSGTGMDTAAAEALGDGVGGDFAEMGFSIEKSSVVAKSRALKAEYSLELAQDLKAIHGLDAETELANILSTEILAEINREVIRTINSQAKTGAQTSNVALKGVFDVDGDADGRWSVEKFKGLMIQIDRECNAIAKDTRRGKGNIAIVSSDVATCLAATGNLDYAPALSTKLNVDDTGNTFAGILNGRIKVYVDPYAAGDYVTVGYKGTNPYDAGVFYCPYVPLQMVRAVGENDFQPRIGFKTRYGMVSNPFVGDSSHDRVGLADPKTNDYYRIMRVDNILSS